MAFPDSQVHLVIGSRIDDIELVQAVLEESLQKLEVDADLSHSIGIAVREAVANAIQHGNLRDPAKRVQVGFGLEGDEVVIQVTDEGEGFDLEGVRDPRTGNNLLQPTGRGILFMNSFMDAIDYSFRADGGTVVTLRKRIATDSPGSGGKEN